MKRLVLALLLGTLVSGCATTQTISMKHRTRTYDVTKEDLISATVNAFTAEGYPIKSIDRKTGFVRTRKKSNSTMEAAFVGNKSRSIQAMVRDQGEQTKITLTLVYEAENAFGQSSAQSVGKNAAIDLYKEWFKRIEQRI